MGEDVSKTPLRLSDEDSANKPIKNTMAKMKIDLHEMVARSFDKNIHPAKMISVKTATAGERSNMPNKLNPIATAGRVAPRCLSRDVSRPEPRHSTNPQHAIADRVIRYGSRMADPPNKTDSG